MVLLNSRDNTIEVNKEEKVVWMAMEPERSSSKPLHNFNLPCGLRWGNQRFLRCMKVNSNGEISAVERRPSSSSSTPAVSNANANNTNSHASASNGFVSIIGKRKEREKFKDPPPPADHRRGSDYKKAGFNFKLPPPPPPPQQPSSSATESDRKFRFLETGGGEDGGGDGIAAVREKLMFDLQTAADKMKDAILREGLESEDQDNPPSPAPAMAPTVAVTIASSEAADASVRPWNLRTRRAACKAPTANGFVSGSAGAAGTSGSGDTTTTASPVKALKVDVMKPNSSLSPLRAENNKSPRLRSGVAMVAAPSCEKKERVKFSVPLTRREIEEDFSTFAGRRPPRRPQKRPKYVQKQLDTLFPGLWLTEITADMYKVPESQ